MYLNCTVPETKTGKRNKNATITNNDRVSVYMELVDAHLQAGQSVGSPIFGVRTLIYGSVFVEL